MRAKQYSFNNDIIYGDDLVLFIFVALRPMSTAMVIAGRSVYFNHTFSWAGLSKRLTSNLCTYFRL